MNLLSQRNSREKEIILPPDVLSRTGGDYYGEENYITLPEIINNRNPGWKLLGRIR